MFNWVTIYILLVPEKSEMARKKKDKEQHTAVEEAQFCAAVD